MNVFAIVILARGVVKIKFMTPKQFTAGLEQ